jgi:hypothetical protein
LKIRKRVYKKICKQFLAKVLRMKVLMQIIYRNLKRRCTFNSGKIKASESHQVVEKFKTNEALQTAEKFQGGTGEKAVEGLQTSEKFQLAKSFRAEPGKSVEGLQSSENFSLRKSFRRNRGKSVEGFTASRNLLAEKFSWCGCQGKSQLKGCTGV